MDPYDAMEERARLADRADAERRARRADWIRRARRSGAWTEIEQLRDLVRRLAAAYRVSDPCNLDLLCEALAAVEAMPPPPWEAPAEKSTRTPSAMI